MFSGRIPQLYFLLVFGAFINGVISDYTSSSNSCSTQEINIRLDRFEKLIDELPEVLAECSDNRKERWSGNQSTIGDFKRLPNEAKQKLKIFRLENTADLEMAALLQFLRPCSNLEVLQLENVELIGDFPDTTAGKLYLPHLHDFRLVLTNYPNLGGQLLDNLLFFKKTTPQSIQLRRIAEYNVNIFIQVGGWMKFGINHDFGELVLNAFTGSESIVVDILNSVKSSPTFYLKRLTLDTTKTISTSLIPADLSYLNLNWVYFNEEHYQLPEFVKVVKAQTRLKELHMRPTDVPGREHPTLDLEDLPRTLERLSLTRVHINATTSPILSLDEILLDGCELYEPTVKHFGRMFNQVKKFAWVPYYALGDSYYKCHAILNQILNNYNRKLSWIFMGDCFRKFEKDKPVEYETVEKILTGAGLDKEAKDFIIEKVDENWVGKRVSSIEKKAIIYKMSGIEKLRSWERQLYL